LRIPFLLAFNLSAIQALILAKGKIAEAEAIFTLERKKPGPDLGEVVRHHSC
jgi:hypothetical protein